MHGANAAAADAPAALGDLIMNVAGREHGPRTIADSRFVQTPQNHTLAVSQRLSYLGVHSTSLRASGDEIVDYSSNPGKRQGFRVFHHGHVKTTGGFACSRIRAVLSELARAMKSGIHGATGCVEPSTLVSSAWPL